MLEPLQHINNFLYTYLIIAVLIGCGLYFTIRTRGVQFRLLKDSCRLLVRSQDEKAASGRHHVSSFQAFAVSLASRVGTGNLVALALLSPKVFKALDDYMRQRKAGIKDPTMPRWWKEEGSE